MSLQLLYPHIQLRRDDTIECNGEHKHTSANRIQQLVARLALDIDFGAASIEALISQRVALHSDVLCTRHLGAIELFTHNSLFAVTHNWHSVDRIMHYRRRDTSSPIGAQLCWRVEHSHFN